MTSAMDHLWSRAGVRVALLRGVSVRGMLARAWARSGGSLGTLDDLLAAPADSAASEVPEKPTSVGYLYEPGEVDAGDGRVTSMSPARWTLAMAG